MAMGLNDTLAMLIPMRVKAFVCNILRRFKARARGHKGYKSYCYIAGVFPATVRPFIG